MRIAIPYPVYWPYSRRGVERCIHDLAGYLTGRGHSVHIITTTPGRPRTARDGDARVTYLRELGHPLVFQYKPMLGVHAACLKMTAVLLREKPDVMHIWSYSGMATGPILSRLGIPYLLHFMMPHRRTEGTLFEALFARLVRGASVVAALTPKGAADVTSSFQVPCDVLPPPVDMSFFRPVSRRNPRRPIVLFTSDLADERKGGLLLLKAWNLLHRSNPRAKLVLCGPSGQAGWSPHDFGRRIRSDLAVVADPAARDAIEIRGAGSLESMPALYSEASVTVLPSYNEAFGMVLTESLACGTPVVTSSDCGPGEIVTNSAVGSTLDIRSPADLADPDRVRELAAAIGHAIELSERPSTASACREWAGQWSLDVVGAQAEHLLDRAMRGGVAPLPSTAEDEAPQPAAAGGGSGWW